jgi:hypothetical protein
MIRVLEMRRGLVPVVGTALLVAAGCNPRSARTPPPQAQLHYDQDGWQDLDGDDSWTWCSFTT